MNNKEMLDSIRVGGLGIGKSEESIKLIVKRLNEKKLSDKEIHERLYGGYNKISDIISDITIEEMMEIKPF